MQGLYKFGLAVGLIGVLGYGGCEIKSNMDKAKEKTLQVEREKERLDKRLLVMDQRLDGMQEMLRRQKLSQARGVLRQYDVDKNGAIEKEEYDKYLKETTQAEKMLKKYDMDLDDFLSKAESCRLLKKHTYRFGRSDPILLRRVLDHVFKRYDRDGNSLLDRMELSRFSEDFDKYF